MNLKFKAVSDPCCIVETTKCARLWRQHYKGLSCSAEGQADKHGKHKCCALAELKQVVRVLALAFWVLAVHQITPGSR